MQNDVLYIYDWFVDNDELDSTCIRCYCLDTDNKTVCLRIDNFNPYIYIELPTHIIWTTSKAQLLSDKIDKLMKNKKPITKSLCYKHKLYTAYFDSEFKRKKFPYLKCTFANKDDIKVLFYSIKKKIQVMGLGYIDLKLHEFNVDPILQYISSRNIPSVGWIIFKGLKISIEEQLTLADREFIVNEKNIRKYKTSMKLPFDTSLASAGLIPIPKILAFDIEVFSSKGKHMFPNASRPDDKIFQISCIFSTGKNYILTLGDPQISMISDPKDVIIQKYNIEADLLLGFTQLVINENPNIITGYNIFLFDIKYMLDRARDICLCIKEFSKLSFHKIKVSKEKNIKWSSSAYKDQEFQCIETEGRIFIDLLPIIKRNYKLNNYQLKTVSQAILKDTKDDLSPAGIFKCYAIGIQKDSEGTYTYKAKRAMSLVAKYCLKDSILVMKLIEKMQIWIGITEEASTYNSSIFSIYTQGQQLKVFSQVYKYCVENDYVIEKDGYVSPDNEQFVGAHVIDPVPGLYERVVPLDFSSLYPSIIIAYNLDYSTIVFDTKIPDYKCHVMNIENHVACEHDIRIIKIDKLTRYIDIEMNKIKKLREERDKKCNKNIKKQLAGKVKNSMNNLRPYTKERADIKKTLPKKALCENKTYRFLKEPKGVVPTILQNLLDARTKTRNQIKDIEKNIEKLKIEPENKYKIQELELLSTVLNKRQLSYKISCNSMYGSFGVKRGYLPFMPGAICTTFIGRKNLDTVSKVIPEKFGAQVVYGDSVTADTPILCRINGKIFYKTIDNIPHTGWIKYKNDKEEGITNDIEVWSDKGFTKIKKIIRHKITKNIYRVLTHTGVVDITEDHGLLDYKSNKISPKEIYIGSELLISDFPSDIKYDYHDINVELAFVMGLFYTDGSCGNCPSDNKSSWVINNADRKLLNKCGIFLNNSKKDTKYEVQTLSFKIIETMESSYVFKLMPVGNGLQNFVNIWRELFYDENKYKKVPDEILWSCKEVRQSFFDGYYCGGGDKDKNGYCRFDNKGKIGSAGLYFLMHSLGYKCSINTKQEIYRITCTKKIQRKKENKVKKIELLTYLEDQYVYDLETENHHFSAGIGKLIVHNTDSNYVFIPHVKTVSETWEYAENMAKEITKLFPPPINLEFEKVIYWQFFILTKKRYMYKACKKDGNIQDEIGKKGVILARRDNPLIVRNIYEDVIRMIFDKYSRDDILYYLLLEINKICSFQVSYEKFVITKSLGDTNNMIMEEFTNDKNKSMIKIGNYKVPALPTINAEKNKKIHDKDASSEMEYYEKSLPAVVQLSKRMNKRGSHVEIGSRMEYVVIDNFVRNDNLYNKIEDFNYFKRHSNVLKLDYLYYIKALINPVDQLINAAFKDNETDFMLKQYNFRNKNRAALIDEINDLTRPIITFK